MIELYDEHPRILGALLIKNNLRWRDVGNDDFYWEDFWCVVVDAMHDPSSNLARVVDLENSIWADPVYNKLVDIADILKAHIAVAQIVGGAKNVKIPKPTKRPGQVDAPDDKRKGESRPIDEIDAMLGMSSSGWD